MRAGKVSIETLHKCTCANAEMRTRPRLSDGVAMVHNVRWTLVLDGPKRSVDCAGAKRRLHAKEKVEVGFNENLKILYAYTNFFPIFSR